MEQAEGFSELHPSFTQHTLVRSVPKIRSGIDFGSRENTSSSLQAKGVCEKHFHIIRNHYCMISLKNTRSFFFSLPPKHSSLEKLKGNGFILCILFSFLFNTCSFLSHCTEFLKGRKNRFYFALA